MNTRNLVAAWAEDCSEPGWSNRVIWCLVFDTSAGTYRVGAIQPEEQTAEMLALFPVCAAATKTLTEEVRSWLYERGKKEVKP